MLHGVLLLTGVTGRDVLGPDGRVLGRLADLTVRLSDQAGPQLVERLVVTRRRSPTLVLPWAVVANVGSDQVVLTVGAARRVLALPSALRRCTVAGAALRDGRLRVRFEPDPTLWSSL